jgi:hypothetical protein
MSKTTVIIEIRNNVPEAIYSNADVSFVIVDQDNGAIHGPYSPTLQTPDLSRAVNGLAIPDNLLTAVPQPYFYYPVDPPADAISR